MCEIKVGSIVQFQYPRHNSVGLKTNKWRSWTICVTNLRDVSRERLHPETIRLRPLTGRGRLLITGICLNRFVERSFYVDAMRHRQREFWLSLGAFDPFVYSDEPMKLFGVFAPTIRDRKFMAKVIDYFCKFPETYHTLTVTPHDGHKLESVRR